MERVIRYEVREVGVVEKEEVSYCKVFGFYVEIEKKLLEGFD